VIRSVIRTITSLRLVAVLLTLAMILVFVGTLAQVEQGLYQAQARYFRTFFVYWSPGDSGLRIPVYPGVYLLGGFMVINLIAVGFTRLKLNRHKFGLVLVHSGLVLLLLGQLLSDLLSVESALQFREGETKQYSEDFHGNELVLVDVTDADEDTVVSVPEWMAARTGRIEDEGTTPFSVNIRAYWRNADLLERSVPASVASTADQGIGVGLHIVAKPPVTKMDERNMPAAIVGVSAGGKDLGSWLVSSLINRAQTWTHEGRTWEIAMRPKRHYQPYSVTLLECRHDIYKGTEIPKNFSSRVRLRDPKTREDREVLIYMNNPLRYGGNTYYQYQMADPRKTDIMFSTLQVVRNPSWLTPYVACSMVGAGLMWQFVYHLLGFLKRKRHEK
jgi:hypothetical protein